MTIRACLNFLQKVFFQLLLSSFPVCSSLFIRYVACYIPYKPEYGLRKSLRKIDIYAGAAYSALFADNLFRVWQMIVLRMPEHKYAVFCYYYRITCYGLDIKKQPRRIYETK